MKKLSIILLMMCCYTMLYAQKKGDSLLIKREVQVKSPITPAAIAGSKSVQTDSKMIPIKPLKLNIASKVLNQTFSKDLAIDQFQISYEPMLKRYTLKCRIFNAGTTDIDLNLLSYYAHGAPNTLGTAVSTSDPGFGEYSFPINIPYDLETELPAGLVENGKNLKLLNSYLSGKTYVLAVTSRDPNAGWVFTINTNTILKPGESAYAMAFDNIVWERNLVGLGPHRIYTIKIDPLNKIGDQNLSNNTISVTVDNFY
jgi:hypothetical protein